MGRIGCLRQALQLSHELGIKLTCTEISYKPLGRRLPRGRRHLILRMKVAQHGSNGTIKMTYCNVQALRRQCLIVKAELNSLQPRFRIHFTLEILELIHVHGKRAIGLLLR